MQIAKCRYSAKGVGRFQNTAYIPIVLGLVT